MLPMNTTRSEMSGNPASTDQTQSDGETRSLRRTVVLGIGNPLMGDDGIGITIVQRLLNREEVSPFAQGKVEILDGGTLGYLLIDRLAGVSELVVVDAANMGTDAGAVRVFEDGDMDDFLASNRKSSVHEVGLIDLLEMLALMGQLPQRRALVGIQPEIVDWQTDLSPAVAASLPRAEAAVMEVVSAWYGASC